MRKRKCRRAAACLLAAALALSGGPVLSVLAEAEASSETVQQEMPEEESSISVTPGTEVLEEAGSQTEQIQETETEIQTEQEIQTETPGETEDMPILMNNSVMRASSPTQTEDSVAKVEMNGQINYFDTLDEAVQTVSEANGTATITLLKDASLTAFSFSPYIAGNITLIGGDHTILISNGSAIIQGVLTIESGKYTEGALYTFPGGTLNVKGGAIDTVSSSLGGNVNIYGGTIRIIEGNNVTYHVSSISLEQSNLTLTVGTTQMLQTTVLPLVSAPHVSITWSSSNEDVAAVSNGQVTAVGPGSATITASADGKSAACTVTVNKGSTTIDNKGGIEGYPSTFIHGDTLPVPAANYFNIVGSDDGFAYQWYEGNHMTGELADGSTETPTKAGSYTLVVTTNETDFFLGGEQRLLVTIQPANYIVTIPSNATVDGDEVSITTGDFQVGQNGRVRVTVSSGVDNGVVTLTQQDTGTENAAHITSQMFNQKDDGEVLKNGDTVALYNNAKALLDGTGSLYFAAPAESNIAAGIYLGTVTFQISYEIVSN